MIVTALAVGFVAFFVVSFAVIFVGTIRRMEGTVAKISGVFWISLLILLVFGLPLYERF